MSNEMHEAIDIITKYADNPQYLMTGSSIICDPPVLNNDIDIVCIYNGGLSRQLQNCGFGITPHAEYPHEGISACYCKGNVNIIAVGDDYALGLWKKATELAKYMNLREKPQRVALFQFITEHAVRGTDITY